MPYRARRYLALGTFTLVITGTILSTYLSVPLPWKKSDIKGSHSPKCTILAFFTSIRTQECLFLHLLGRKTDALSPIYAESGWKVEVTGNSALPKLMKPIKALEYITKQSNLFDDDIVLFLDTDVYISSSFNIKMVEKIYLEEFGPNTFVVMGEKNIWPWYLDIERNEIGLPDASAIRERYLAVQGNDVSSSFRYVNSGSWISSVGVAKSILRDIARAVNDPKTSGVDDQYYFTMKYLYNNSDGRMVVDVGCNLFQSAHKTSIAKLQYLDTKASLAHTGDAHIIDDGRIYNSESKTYPLFAHFNGDKSMFETLMRKFLDLRKSLLSIFDFDIREKLDSCIDQ
jgi:hypothetical protein